MAEHHICIVSEQLVPNLLACLHYKPQHVHLVISAEMKAEGGRLRDLLSQCRMAVTLHGNLPGTGLDALLDYAVTLAHKIRAAHPAADLTLNITGGTKLMALTAYIGFWKELERFEVLYTDTDHLRFERLTVEDSGEYAADPIPGDLLDVRTFLAAQGCRVHEIMSERRDWTQRAVARKDISAYLADSAADLNVFFGAVNYAASQCFQRDPKTRREAFRPRTQNCTVDEADAWVAWAWTELQSRGFVSVPAPGRVEFLHEDAARYLGGGWIEEWVWLCASDAGLTSARAGVTISDATDARNEFDVVATVNNRVLLIECKTANLTDSNLATNVVYKFDSLGQRLARLFSYKWFVTARPMDANSEKRAKSYGIEVVGARQLGHLRERFQSLMKR